ncbi:UDP-forming cellulose synthase catalytic subunit [Acidicapsa dinghuensis]|uniref:Cellulose synthase catalytic subunit [UDP-forming] n=1 Tax=Acidicapsa dinghuensis TaxID=2218256 RepID=A0ABW1EL49_9BACT|nr:UDP-forming cellulose synthase catalytic subunit [Acidicapsa dinghuensis]
MSLTQVWHDIGAGETFTGKLVRFFFLCFAVVAFYFFATLPLTWPQQAVCGLLTLLLGLALGRTSDSYLITLTLMILSLFSTFRYGYWRLATTVQFFQDPSNHWGALDAFFILSLVFAESYAFVILFLGFFQTIWPLRRAPMPLPENTEEWPHIDVLIPTYNEPLEVVRYTALGALNIDWPADKLHVYILDDGRRKEFEEFAFQAGVGYKIRPDNFHAKAGNINTALKSLHSPYVAIFDCDHVPTRSFLQMTIGWFLRDRNLAMLQTPHHFYSPDPFERNLGQFHIIPNENELFYGIVQDGNDFWNATFFCGSCAVLRREALDEIGGIAVETVTEDAHTSLRMQSNGWNTAYINIPQAAGLATERLSAHVGQRIRWARGMIQILRTDNPLLAPKLSFAQRLCYFNAMAHFLYPLPRLIFLTAPLIYLLLSHTNVPGYWGAILAYALPHLTLSNITNSRIQGAHRHSWWNEIYETVLSPYILLPTMLALVNPKLGKFNVTAKGGIVKRSFFDVNIARPFLVLLFLNFLGLAVAIPRFFIWDHDRPGTVIMNCIWCFFNIVVLGVCSAVSREMQQLRQHVRIKIVTPVTIRLSDGREVKGETLDLSSGGTAIRLNEAFEAPVGDDVRLIFPLPSLDADLPASIVTSEKTLLRIKFSELNIQEQEFLTMVLYSRADTWLGWGESREVDQPMVSLARIFAISFKGLKMTFFSLFFRQKTAKGKGLSKTTKAAVKGKSNVAARAHMLLLFLLPALLLVSGSTRPALSQPAISGLSRPLTAASAPAPAPGQFHDTFTLADIGTGPIEMHGVDSTRSIFFALPQTHVVRMAKIHIYYSFSPALLQQMSHIQLMLNGTLFATLPVPPDQTAATGARQQDAEISIPAELLVQKNILTIEFIGHYVMVCEDPMNTVLWARVATSTFLDFTGDVLPITDDLKHLPQPFLDTEAVAAPKIPVVFPSAPSSKAIQAAGVVASYFGVQSENRAIRFPTYVGAAPAGNAIIIAENPASLPGGLNLGNISGPTVAMRPNPTDPYSKVLIVTGQDADQTLMAAWSVAQNASALAGPMSMIDSSQTKPPVSPAADEAPRWARTDGTIALWDYASAESLQTDGSAPLNVYFRVPPDMFFGEQSNAILKMVYRYNPIPIGPISSLQVRVNNAYLGSLPLIPGSEATREIKTEVPVPVVNLRPFSNSLSFDFTFQMMKKGGCSDTTPINMQGAILRDTYLDLRGYPHYASLPNLEIFANAGYPFTRYADLSQTTVVLPAIPTPQELEMFLTLMGHFGRQTGMPVFRVKVDGADAMKAGADTDFLVLGTGDDQPAFAKIGDKLPVNVEGGQVQIRDTEGVFGLPRHAWWKIPVADHTDSGDLTASGTPDSVIEGVESPYQPGRSVVIINVKDAATYDAFLTTFLKVQQASDINGSVSVLHGSLFQSFRLGGGTYHVGSLPLWTRLRIWFSKVPWLAALGALALSFLLAIWVRIWLRSHARKRLQLED